LPGTAAESNASRETLRPHDPSRAPAAHPSPTPTRQPLRNAGPMPTRGTHCRGTVSASGHSVSRHQRHVHRGDRHHHHAPGGVGAAPARL